VFVCVNSTFQEIKTQCVYVSFQGEICSDITSVT